MLLASDKLLTFGLRTWLGCVVIETCTHNGKDHINEVRKEKKATCRLLALKRLVKAVLASHDCSIIQVRRLEYFTYFRYLFAVRGVQRRMLQAPRAQQVNEYNTMMRNILYRR